MKTPLTRRWSGGFTVWDLLIVLVTVALLLGFVLPYLAKSRSKSARLGCDSNLKQIGLAVRMWANDHGDQFSWAHSTNFDGSLEHIGTSDPLPHFLVLEKELNSPKALACANDASRRRVSDWRELTNSINLSYFLCFEAEETKSQTVLSGDRNLETNHTAAVGFVRISAVDKLRWGAGIHRGYGNLAMADGSAQQRTKVELIDRFQATLLSTTQAAVRLVIPK